MILASVRHAFAVMVPWSSMVDCVSGCETVVARY
jgi:hypothetical protein